jgi:GNAT superfamily N-acetyltransferase
MKFREGVIADIVSLVEHGEEFWTHTTYFKKGRPYNDKAVGDLCLWLITHDHGFITVLADEDNKVRGFGLVIVTPFIFDPTFTSAMELAYYIDPEVRGQYGVALLKEMEKTAKEQGADFMSMITMEDSSPEVAASIYNKLGYEKNEVVYTKEIGNCESG